MSQLPAAQAASDHPLYNIGVVERMTGIGIATLRAWERRYHFPISGRTEGGHRLYSERDVIRLRWVKAQIDQGMQTAQAIHALQFQETSGRILDNIEMATGSAGSATPQPTTHRGRLVQALIHFDTDRADMILGEALPLMHPEGLILEVIGPALVDIGEAWATNEINIATEHLATQYLRQRLLMWMGSGPPAYPVRPALLACAPGELHEGGLLMLGALLRRRRWPVAYLGQSVPLADLAALVRDITPSAVVVVATSDETASSLIEWPQWMPEAAQSGKPVVAYAGRVFVLRPEWRLRVPGLFLGTTIAEGLDVLEGILR